MSLLRDRELASAFDHAAAAYDRLVAVNPGYHSQLRRSARRLAARTPRSAAPRVLDLGCGTGASTAALARALPGARITAADASAGMLERARARAREATRSPARSQSGSGSRSRSQSGSGTWSRPWSGSGSRAERWPDGVEFVHAPAEELADAGVHGPFDAVFAAYLFRNVAAPDAVLSAVRRLLAPGGVLGVHEYTLTGAWAHRALWTAVCRGVVVPAGSLYGDGRLYRHLWRSVREFDTAAAFAARLRGAGFAGVRVLPVTGWQWGVVHTFLARAPYGAAPHEERAASEAPEAYEPPGPQKPAESQEPPETPQS